MKLALITTTINVPRVLSLYRAHDAHIPFFVAADEKTPDEAYAFCADLGNCEIYTPERQSEFGYECSDHIGWNSIGRRNIALLEAVKSGAEVIVTIDDDNIPMDMDYFVHLRAAFDPRQRSENFPFRGLEASSPQRWFDVGQLLTPPAKHRGFPINVFPSLVLEPVTSARIGVAAGACLGDPDIDACTRIVDHPVIHLASEVLKAGVVTDPRRTRTVFNSQNTAFRRDLAACMFMMPALGRFDDIYASLICQRVMADRGQYVHFGQPFVWQQRNSHNLIDDLIGEIDGMANVEKFAEALWRAPIHSDSTYVDAVTACRSLVGGMRGIGLLPDAAIEAAMAFYDDLEKVL